MIRFQEDRRASPETRLSVETAIAVFVITFIAAYWWFTT